MSALKVLIFEYDRPFADALERAFARRGCSVRVVDDGQTGLDVALDDRPGLIILAIELPRMNGFAVCNRIKKHSDLKDIPLVIVSSDSPPETFEQHSKLRTRAEDYAHKPIEPEALIARAAAFVDIPPARDSEIMVDEEAIEEAHEDAPIDLDDDMGGLSDAAFDNIVMESVRPGAEVGAAALLEPLPEPSAGRSPSPQGTSDDFEDYTMVSSSAELPLDVGEVARAVQASPPVSRPPSGAPPSTKISGPPLARVGVTPPSLSSFPEPTPSEPPATRTPSAHQMEAERLQRRVEELERGLSAAQAATERAEALTEENHNLRARGDELARVTGELEEKVRVATAAAAATAAAPTTGAAAPVRPGGISTREFLELRESLNRKDKDIHARDREILELRDKLLQAEMSTADIDDRLAERDLEIAAAGQAGDAVRAELQAETERRAEVERALAEARQATTRSEASLRQQVADAEAQRALAADANQRELAALRAQVEAAVAATASHAAQITAQQAAETALREGHARALEAARSESLAAAQQGESALRAEHEGALEASRSEHSAALSALRSEHAQVVDSLRSDYTTAVDAVKGEHGRALASKEAEHAAALESLRAERDQGLGALASEHAAALAAAVAATAAAVAAESSTRRELSDRIGALGSELAAARTSAASLSTELSSAQGRAEESAREVAALRDRLAAAERRRASAEALLDRARQAMEIAAGLVHAATQEQPAEGADSASP